MRRSLPAEVCGISIEPQSFRDACIRCGEAPPVDTLGYCGRCIWQVRVEIEDGLKELRSYLAHWREFRDWETGRS